MRLASWADIALRPAYTEQVLQAGCVIFETLVEHLRIFGVCVHAHTLYVKSVTSSLYPHFFIILVFICVSYGFLHAFSSDLKTKKVFFEQIFFPGDSS